MTRDKKRKAAIREAKTQTGRRYTALAREMMSADGTEPRDFLFAHLLTECATLPPVDVDWGYDSSLAPEVFHSRLLGGPVPYGTVLELGGQLTQEGRSARLTLESRSHLEVAVVACGKRRFQLVLTQDMVLELCQTPGCRQSMPSWAIPYCADHLASCDTDTLVSMAQEWGNGHSEAFGQDLERIGGSSEADLLIKAATTNGSFEQVSTALLNSAFADPEAFEDMFYSEEHSLAMRYAMERERLRLYKVGHIQAQGIRKAVGLCPSCKSRLSTLRWDPRVPAAICSSKCAPLTLATSTTPALSSELRLVSGQRGPDAGGTSSSALLDVGEEGQPT